MYIAALFWKLGEEIGNNSRNLCTDPTCTGAKWWPVRGDIQFLLRGLRSLVGARPVPDLRGKLPGGDRWIRDFRGGLRTSQVTADRFPFQALLHFLPEGHSWPSAWAPRHSGPTVTSRGAHSRCESLPTTCCYQELYPVDSVCLCVFGFFFFFLECNNFWELSICCC